LPGPEISARQKKTPTLAKPILQHDKNHFCFLRAQERLEEAAAQAATHLSIFSSPPGKAVLLLGAIT